MSLIAWEARIERARLLAGKYPAASEPLLFYARVAEAQAGLERGWSGARPALSPELIEGGFPSILLAAERHGPPDLAEAAERLHSEGSGRWTQIVEDHRLGIEQEHWESFFARAFLQPYAELGGDVEPGVAGNLCPRCGLPPLAAVLREESYGARRSLVCALCSTEWEFRRILCPNCGETSFDKLPVFTSPDFETLRVEACDSCKSYLLSVDMTKDATAVPAVDELAGLSLNLWAQQQGYRKLHPNLLGL